MKQTVSPYLFERSLILALDANWIYVFGGKLFFRVSIDKKGRLCIISQQHVTKE